MWWANAIMICAAAITPSLVLFVLAFLTLYISHPPPSRCQQPDLLGSETPLRSPGIQGATRCGRYMR